MLFLFLICVFYECCFSKDVTIYFASFYSLEYFLLSWRYSIWELCSHWVTLLGPAYLNTASASESHGEYIYVPCPQDIWTWDSVNTGSQHYLAATTLRCETLELLVALAILSSGYNTGEKASTDSKTRERQTRVHTHTEF